MLNVDYKILAKAIANRLKSVYPDIIAEMQTGFMEHRTISTTIRATIDIANYNKKMQGYLLNLDFEKCFDRIEYRAIEGSLRYLSFGETFVEWVRLLCTEFTATTSNNGYFSDYLTIERSCHQDCPMAPLLYNACREVLSCEILKNVNVHGITLNNLQNIIAQFADDTQFYLSAKDSVETVIQLLADIETNIGLRVNYEKSSIHRIANAPAFKCSKPLVWAPGGIAVLGINVFDEFIVNYKKILHKANNVLQTWYHRQLSLMDKILIINTLVCSLFVYLMQVERDPPDCILKEFDSIVHAFLWRDKKAKIKMSQIQAPRKFSRLKLTNLKLKNASIKIAWIFQNSPFAKVQLEAIPPPPSYRYLLLGLRPRCDGPKHIFRE